jgi:putative RecB family exonuclease
MLYKLGRIDKLTPEFTADALEFGVTVHKVLADFYQAKMNGTKLSLDELLANFEMYWRHAAEERTDIKFKAGQDFYSLLHLGKGILSVYYSNLPDDNFRVVAIEEPFSFTLPDIPVPIIGVTDLIEEDASGTIIITDFKTASKAYSDSEIDDSLQLTLYSMGMKNNGYKEREILLRFDVLVKTKQPKFEQYYTTRSETDERRAINKIREVWEGISKSVFIPNNTNWKCKGCCFKTACDERMKR